VVDTHGLVLVEVETHGLVVFWTHGLFVVEWLRRTAVRLYGITGYLNIYGFVMKPSTVGFA
jgi:hypothetical protein